MLRSRKDEEELQKHKAHMQGFTELQIELARLMVGIDETREKAKALANGHYLEYVKGVKLSAKE